MRLAMAIDLERCVGCKACVSACKEQWDSGPGAARCWVDAFEDGTRETGLALSFYPGLCMQCEDHPCTAACPTGATAVDPRTGVVRVDPDACIGCASCVPACPYGARSYDPEKRIVEKCDLCAPFVARGEQPACVATCPAECRTVGDLDDPASALAARARAGRPLATPAVDVRPRTSYAGDAHRARILAAGVVRAPGTSALARSWAAALPLVRGAVPAFAAVSIAGGVLVNLKARADRVRRGEAEGEGERGERGEREAGPAELDRHRAGLRVLHWWNALSWVVLATSGAALLSAAGFAVAGARFPRWLAGLAGGGAALLRLHVWWGLAWAATIVPLFLLWKGGPRGVLEEIRLREDDLRWLLVKPLAMAGLRAQPLPPQDKYNAGQKLFAVFVLVATTTIVATGLVMTFHLGPPALVAAAVAAHGLSIALVLVGLAIHVTMAVVIAEERPALMSMITGRIDARHARRHNPRWFARVAPGAGDAPEEE
jgi:formate dehydrogenase gamma subunit